MRRSIALLAATLLGACASLPPAGDPPAPVRASAETAPVGTSDADAADDPAIWRDPIDPARSLIVATDKKAGLHVYDLSGAERHFIAAPGLNNVDLVELTDGGVLVVASDRSDLASAHVALFRLDPAAGRLTPWGRVPVAPGEGYGLCLGPLEADGSVTAYSPLKGGPVHATRLTRAADGRWTGVSRRLFATPTQPEGCVLDARTGRLYVGEERAGVWVHDLGAGTSRLAIRADGRQLVPDVEGVALAPVGTDGGNLIVSSQGDNAYARYRLPDLTPAGRFAIVDGPAADGTQETDGIALDVRSFGPAYPAGLFVAQDGRNVPASQNFKLVSWGAVMEALDGGD